jgi:hypothetical protein
MSYVVVDSQYIIIYTLQMADSTFQGYFDMVQVHF